nr:Hypothetical protein [Pseudomonas aeruginosa]
MIFPVNNLVLMNIKLSTQFSKCFFCFNRSKCYLSFKII